MNRIQELTDELLDLTDDYIFAEFYPHTNRRMWKIMNVYTPYKSDKIVLCDLEYGVERALELAVDIIKKTRAEFLGMNNSSINQHETDTRF